MQNNLAKGPFIKDVRKGRSVCNMRTKANKGGGSKGPCDVVNVLKQTAYF